MRGEISSGKYSKRQPYDWYVDEIWCARQLRDALGGFRMEHKEGLAIWDPCAGFGNTVQAAWELGLDIYLGDIVERVAWCNFEDMVMRQPIFQAADFREVKEAPAPCSIIFNPPYSYENGILEQCVRHALTLATRRVCALVPSKWLSPGKDVKVWSNRSRLFREDHPPQAILHMSERPSMPPGDMIAAMGNRAFRGGMTDYCWIIWDVERPTAANDTRTIWLPPLVGHTVEAVAFLCGEEGQ